MQVESKTTNEKLIETKVSKHGVFTLVKDETGVRIVIQNILATDKIFNTYEEAEKYISTKPYQLILIASHIYHNTVVRLQNEQKYYEQNKDRKESENSSTNN